MTRTLLLTAACLLAGAATAPATGGNAHGAADTVAIYRCTDAEGHLSLRDSPCPRGSREDLRTMQRPVDATPVATAPGITSPVQPASAPLVLSEPQRVTRPLFLCLQPDGRQYTSDSPEGNPRAVPLRSLPHGALSRQRGVGQSGSLEAADTWSDTRGRSGQAVTVLTSDNGDDTLVRVRDECHALPQAQACAALRTQRDALGNRAFNAQPSHRTQIEQEREQVIARIATDC